MKTKFMFEVIGLAGSGKSTISEELFIKNKNIRGSIDFELINFSIIKHIGKLLRIFLITKNKRHVVEFISYQMLVQKIKKYDYSQKEVVCFDQGPFFRITKLIIEIPKLEGLFLEELEVVLPYFKELFYLEAPIDTLVQRVKNRNQVHRIKNLSYGVQYRFLVRYKNKYDEVLQSCLDSCINVYRIDTKKNSINKVVKIVNEQVKGKEKFI